MSQGPPERAAGPVARPGGTAELAERIAAAAAACPGVAGLAAGPHRVLTYRPGVPLRGVAVRESQVEVSVVVRPERPVTETAEAVRAAVAPLAEGRRVDVVVADLAPADEQSDEQSDERPDEDPDRRLGGRLGGGPAGEHAGEPATAGGPAG